MSEFNAPNIRFTDNSSRGGINLYFDFSGGEPLQFSPCWQSAGRRIQFIYLTPFQSLTLPEGINYIKVVIGRLHNIELNSLAAPFMVRSTKVTCTEVVTDRDFALIAIMTFSRDTPEQVTEAANLRFHGEYAEHLIWKTFHERFGHHIDIFRGKDCYMANGFHLRDEFGKDIVYVNPWACGKGIDLSTHDHSGAPSALAPAFAEIHWVLASGTPDGGMYQTNAPGHAERTYYPMSLGEEHGPFYNIDSLGLPILLDNGAVHYPWHGWQGGGNSSSGQSYDYVWAFEISIDFVESAAADRKPN